MQDPNVQKIKESNQKELDQGDIKRTVIQIQDYLSNIEPDKDKRDKELAQIVRELKKEYEIKRR